MLLIVQQETLRGITKIVTFKRCALHLVTIKNELYHIHINLTYRYTYDLTSGWIVGRWSWFECACKCCVLYEDSVLSFRETWSQMSRATGTNKAP